MTISKHNHLGIIGIVLIAIALWSSCNGSKKVVTDSTTLSERPKKYVVKQMANHIVASDVFSAKAKIKYDDGDQRISLNANIRMKKDSLIWINASLFGFEVARVLIRPDSIFVLNRIEKSYIADSYDGFDKAFQIPITFVQMQQVLMGNNLLETDYPIALSFHEDHYQLKQKTPSYATNHQVDAKTYEVKIIEVNDVESGYQIQAAMDDYKMLDKSTKIPYFRNYIINNNNVYFASIQLNLSDIDIQEAKKTPFKIPAHYAPSD